MLMVENFKSISKHYSTKYFMVLWKKKFTCEALVVFRCGYPIKTYLFLFITLTKINIYKSLNWRLSKFPPFILYILENWNKSLRNRRNSIFIMQRHNFSLRLKPKRNLTRGLLLKKKISGHSAVGPL